MMIIPVFIRHFTGGVITTGGIGIFTNDLLNSAIGNLGTTLLLITIVSLYIIIAFDISTEKMIYYFNKLKPAIDQTITAIVFIKPFNVNVIAEGN